MTQFNKLTVGSILGESQYYEVEKIVGNQVQMACNGESVILSKEYVERFLQSADQFTTEEKVTGTDLINIILANPRTVMSVYFQKADQNKTKKDIKEETEQWAKDVQAAFLAKGASAIEEYAQKPVIDYIPGEMRKMKGYFLGEQDERGRLKFIDMEKDKKGNKNIPKVIDPRTTQYVIVNNIKYTLKK